MTEWQDISTAPKDGSKFETGFEPFDGLIPAIAWFNGESLIQPSWPMNGKTMTIVRRPTHWRPITTT